MPKNVWSISSWQHEYEKPNSSIPCSEQEVVQLHICICRASSWQQTKIKMLLSWWRIHQTPKSNVHSRHLRWHGDYSLDEAYHHVARTKWPSLQEVYAPVLQLWTSWKKPLELNVPVMWKMNQWCDAGVLHKHIGWIEYDIEPVSPRWNNFTWRCDGRGPSMMAQSWEYYHHKGVQDNVYTAFQYVKPTRLIVVQYVTIQYHGCVTWRSIMMINVRPTKYPKSLS